MDESLDDQTASYASQAAGARPSGIETNEDIKESCSEVDDLKRIGVHYESESSKGTADVVCAQRSDDMAASLDQDGESQRDIKQDCESRIGQETAQVDENREVEEADAENLLPLALSDGDMIEEGKTEPLDTKIKELEDSRIEPEEVKRELKEEEDEQQMEVERGKKIKEENKEIERGDAKEVEKQTEVVVNKEKEMEDEEMQGEEEKELEKETEEDEETKVEANNGKEMEEEMQVGEEKEVEKETEEDEETEVEANKGKEMEEEMQIGEGKEVEKETEEDEETEVNANKGKEMEEEMQVGEEKEVEKETEEDKETEVEANKGKEIEEMQVQGEEEVEKEIEEDEETEVEANKGKEMEEEMQVGEEKEVENETEEDTEKEVEANKGNGMEEEMQVGKEKEVEKEIDEDEEKEVEANKGKEVDEMQAGEEKVQKETELVVNKEKEMEDEEIQGGEEQEVEKEIEEDDETKVEANNEKEMEEEMEVGEEKVENETEVVVNKEKEMEGDEIQGGEEEEPEKEPEEDEEIKVEANNGKEMEEETQVEEEKEVEKETEEDEETKVEANNEKEMQVGEDKEVEKEIDEDESNKVDSHEDEEIQGGEVKEVENVREKEANKLNEMEDEEMEGDEETKVEGEADEETEDEEERDMEDAEREQSSKNGSGKRKRGRNSEAVGKTSSKKKVREDVCFICLDDGDLVFCDRRGCRKGYHPSCAELDEAFFQSKGRWTCGWHLCNLCKKAAYFMCYTCQFALCKGCARSDATCISVRGNKGLCGTCMRSVMLIESDEGNAEVDEAAVDDNNRKHYLFKEYWAEQKETLSLTLDEIAQAKSQWIQELPTETLNTDSDTYLTPDSKRNKPKKRMRSSTKEVEFDAEASNTKKKGKKGLKSLSKEDYDSDNSSKDNVGSLTRGRKAKKLSKHSDDISSQSSADWASKELLEFVMHMKEGDRSPLSQYDVQELLLEYIQRNKLRDPRRKSQIVCDAMLQKLFGKPRVGHFEMLKLLELHFLIKEDSQADDNQGSVVDAEGSQLDADENADSLVDLGKYRGKKARKKGDGRLQSNLDDYAAIDMHNITLIYLRRNVIEALLEEIEGFNEKVIGSFVRIRIPGNNQKQDIYRLVQIIGTNKAEPYKVGKRIAYCMLEILNLNKTEVVSIDTISNQDFTEDECKRLRQSIKCGLINRLTVGDVMDKAKDLQAVKVTDWLETEITRLNHLRDRASDLGRKKELRECVEKLQLLSTPEERQRRLDEIPEVHADPNMDPSHESEDESEPEEKVQEINFRPRETPFQWRERDHFPSRKGESGSTDAWSPTERPPPRKWESSRSSSGKGKAFSSRLDDSSVLEETYHSSPWSPVRDKLSSRSTSSETFRTTIPDSSSSRGKMAMRNNPPAASDVVKNPVKISDSEKLWHYKDPSGKEQGPFSVSQLRKWNKSGYFPATLHIWRSGESEDDAIYLTEALAGRFERLPSQMRRKSFDSPSSHQTYRGQPLKVDQMSPVLQRASSPPPPSSSLEKRRSNWSSGRSKVSRWSGSPTPIQLPTGGEPNGMLPSPTPETRSHLAQQPQPPPQQQPVMDATAANLGHGWGGGYMPNPETTNNNAAAIQQQTVYGQWTNAPANNLPPPPPPPPTYPVQNPSPAAAMPSQVPWTPQAPAATQPPPMQQWPAAQYPTNSGAAWAPPPFQQGNPNVAAAWGPPAGQYGSQPPPGNMNMTWQPAGNMGPGGWAPPPVNPGGPGQWRNWQQQPPPHGAGMGPPARPGRRKSDMPCPFFMQGHCKKGGNCDYRHN